MDIVKFFLDKNISPLEYSITASVAYNSKLYEGTLAKYGDILIEYDKKHNAEKLTVEDVKKILEILIENGDTNPYNRLTTEVDHNNSRIAFKEKYEPLRSNPNFELYYLTNRPGWVATHDLPILIENKKKYPKEDMGSLVDRINRYNTTVDEYLLDKKFDDLIKGFFYDKTIEKNKDVNHVVNLDLYSLSLIFKKLDKDTMKKVLDNLKTKEYFTFADRIDHLYKLPIKYQYIGPLVKKAKPGVEELRKQKIEEEKLKEEELKKQKIEEEKLKEEELKKQKIEEEKLKEEELKKQKIKEEKLKEELKKQKIEEENLKEEIKKVEKLERKKKINGILIMIFIICIIAAIIFFVIGIIYFTILILYVISFENMCVESGFQFSYYRFITNIIKGPLFIITYWKNFGIFPK